MSGNQGLVLQAKMLSLSVISLSPSEERSQAVMQQNSLLCRVPNFIFWSGFSHPVGFILITSICVPCSTLGSESVLGSWPFSAARTLDADCLRSLKLALEVCWHGSWLGVVSLHSVCWVWPGCLWLSVYGNRWNLLALLALFFLLEVLVTLGEYFFLELMWSDLFTFLQIFSTW